MKYCLSGGAFGADSLFAVIGEELGYKTLAYSFKGHKLFKGTRIEIPDNDLYKHMVDYRRVSSLMGRAVSNNPYVQKLIIRDFYQIMGRYDNKTELVIAVGELDKDNINIKGGTGYAICFARENKIPLILIDKGNNYSYKFFDYDKGVWRTLLNKDIKDIKINKGFTGIGSRSIDTGKARKSIIRLLVKVL